MLYLGIFDQKCFIGVFLCENFINTIVICEFSILNFFYLENLTTQQQYLNLGPKIPDLGILGLEFENKNVILEISTLEFV